MNLKNNLLYVLTSLFILSSCHVVKSVIYLRPDHKDGKKFPKNIVASGEQDFTWKYHEEQLAVNQINVTYKDSTKVSLDEMLNNGVTNAFIVIKDAKILYENYYNNYEASRKHGSFSVAKGMLSSMLGIALDEGLIESLEEPITNYIPELWDNDSAFSKISIHNLLDMNSGIKVRGKDASLFGDLAKTYYGNNWARFMSTIEIDSLPGGPHVYNQTDPQLLSLIIHRVSGKTLSEYFSEKVWSKIATQEAYWNTYGKDNLEKGFCCFNARPLDFAKFALLYLQNGKWNGEQIIPKEWVSFATTIDEAQESKHICSFHKYWFPANDAAGDYTAQGYNSQMIYFNPMENLIILRFGNKEEWDVINWEEVMRTIAAQIP